MNVHFSSLRLDWKTPKAVYQILDAEFHFDHDPCPPKYKIDGLTSEWGNSNFVNPPYGDQLPKWIEKGFQEYKKGKTVVFLIPSRTDTRWWHDYCMKATEIRFIKGRLKFDDQKNSAPFPSAIVIFNRKCPRCEGSGYKQWYDLDFRPGSLCGLCKGSGLVDLELMERE